ncbi:MAG: glycosyltransferase family 9 protein [Ignavibacteria bacterium]
MKTEKNKIPLKLRFFRTKNTGFLTFTDNLINIIKPSKKFSGLPKKILFIRIDKIGDSLVTLPVLRDLKLNYPEIQIHVLDSEVNHFVFKELRFIDKAYTYPPDNWDNTKNIIKEERYDAVVDLVGVNKKLLFGLRRISKFLAGSRTFMLSWLFDYYSETNWVAESDDRLMSFKIKDFLKDCFGFDFSKADKTLPYNPGLKRKENANEFDILIHLGTSELRKLSVEAEERLIESLKNYKLLITDGSETERFKSYKAKYSSSSNIIFKLYPQLMDTEQDAASSRLILCYDGGQAHFMSQFTKTIVIIGTVTAAQWAPFEFEDYINIKTWENGMKADMSKGKFGHIALYYPIWCCPCFDIGCETKPCINNIDVANIAEIIKENLN